MQRHELIASLRKLRPALEAEGVAHLALYGSRARGDNRADSDVDLLVEIQPDIKFSLLDLIGVQHLVQDSVGLEANAVMRRSLEPDFRARILGDIVEVF